MNTNKEDPPIKKTKISTKKDQHNDALKKLATLAVFATQGPFLDNISKTDILMKANGEPYKIDEILRDVQSTIKYRESLGQANFDIQKRQYNMVNRWMLTKKKQNPTEYDDNMYSDFL